MADIRTRPEGLPTGMLLAGVGGFLDATDPLGPAALLAWIIAAFAVGAGVGGLCTRLVHHRAAWIAAAVLVIVLVAIVVETWRLDRRERPATR